MIKNLLTCGCLALVLASCSGKHHEVSSVSATVSTPGSQSDFEQNVANTVYFGFDRFYLVPEAKDTLAAAVSWLKLYTDRKIVVEGHTDKRGTSDYNLALGNRRAEAVKDYLEQNGVEGSRISVISYGKESLISQGDTEQDHALNRRAHVIIAE